MRYIDEMCSSEGVLGPDMQFRDKLSVLNEPGKRALTAGVLRELLQFALELRGSLVEQSASLCKKENLTEETLYFSFVVSGILRYRDDH